MKHRILVIIIAMMYGISVRAQIVAWNLTSAVTSATTVNPHIVASSITVVPPTAIQYQVSPGDIYCGTWSTSSSFSPSGKYWEFSITPNYGYQIAISSVTFSAGRTATGPSKIQVQYSLDDFATPGITALGETSNDNTSSLTQFSLSMLPPTTSAKITFRIWGYAASSTGNFRLNNINIYGSVISTLDPGSGVGVATVTPQQLSYNTPTTLRFVVTPAGDTLNGIRFIKHPLINWNSSTISIMPESLLPTIYGDTVEISSVNIMNQDSVIVTFSDITGVDTTTFVPIEIQTFKGSSSYGRISTFPQFLLVGSPRPMSWVKAKDASGLPVLYNKYVVVRGVVTVANEFGGPSYMQDETAAIAVYDSSVSRHVNRGDDIIVLGKVTPYYEMFELTSCQLLQVVSEGNTFDTTVITIPQIKAQPPKGVEPYECRLIRVSNITKVLTTANSPATTWSVTGGGTNYKLVAGADTLEIRILANTNIANTAVPTSAFDVVGVLGQYYTSYQILPRSLEDIILTSAGPRIVSGIPFESAINSTSVTFRWETDIPSSSIVRYGTSSDYSSFVADLTAVTIHEITVTNLTPATVYRAKIGSAAGSDTTWTSEYIFSTSSATATGVINVYFNKSIDASVARAETATIGSIYQHLINRINNAQHKIDAAFYSLSGTVGGAIASALVDAKNRGVQVRVIGEKDNSNTAAWNTLLTNGVPVLFDDADVANNRQGLMHNKFVVIDNGDDGDETNDWLWTGSWNATDAGNNNDAQNVIEIQDKALANAYTLEFNEMWGSTTSTPNTSLSRFGSNKLNNTPHYFVINGIPVEAYFSPSDGTTSQIIKTFHKAQESINFAILSFTRNDIANELTYRFRNGVKVRGVCDNRTDSGSEYDTLVARGLDVHLKANLTGLLHHKYAIIDANGNDANKYVLTGSHNWSSSAEERNDENTLILQSARLANLYLQEFSQRYKDAGGTDVLLDVKNIGHQLPQSYALLQNYPNPFNPTTYLEFHVRETAHTTLTIYDVLGRTIAKLVDEVKPAGVYRIVWDARNVPSGVYFYQLKSGGFTATKRMVLLK